MLTRAAKYLIEECVCVDMCNTCTLLLTQIFGLRLLVLILFQWLSLGSSPLIVAAAKLACMCIHIVTMVISHTYLSQSKPNVPTGNLCLVSFLWIGRNNTIHGGMGLCLYHGLLMNKHYVKLA